MIDLKTVIVNSDGEPMKQNFKIKETDDNGKEIETTERREVVLKDLIKVALLNQSQDDVNDKERGRLNEKIVNMRYRIWRKLQGKDEVILDKKEIKLLKKLIYQHYELLVAGQALEILNN